MEALTHGWGSSYRRHDGGWDLDPNGRNPNR